MFNHSDARMMKLRRVSNVTCRKKIAIILGSLPESHRPLLSPISVAAKITTKQLTPHELIRVITEEYEHRQLSEYCFSDRRSGKKGGNSAFTAKDSQCQTGPTWMSYVTIVTL